LHVHLGLYGKFRLHGLPIPEPRGQVRLRVVGKERAFDLNGPLTCCTITEQQWANVQARLGSDPLRADGSVEQVWKKINRSRAAIGSLLLNQSVIAGVGNIYRSEVLHLLDIHPATPGQTLSRQQVESLWYKLKSLLEIGVKYNRIIIAEPKDIGKPRSRMNREERVQVPDCGTFLTVRLSPSFFIALLTWPTRPRRLACRRLWPR
jgi:endonuclease-8